jgi:hypothetical protein
MTFSAKGFEMGVEELILGRRLIWVMKGDKENNIEPNGSFPDWRRHRKEWNNQGVKNTTIISKGKD